ncbi:MAG: CHAT domain-containing protein [Bacteroidota bacterium]
MGLSFRPSSSFSRLSPQEGAEPARPAIILGCANSYQDPHRQAQLVKERKGISYLFRRSYPQRPVEILEENPAERRFIFDLLRAQRYRWRSSMLHLAGYSEGDYIHLNGGLGEEPLKAKSLATLISRLPGLKLVFLNGCATAELVGHLLRLDLPAVIATQARNSRTEATPTAMAFYEAMLRGRSLRQAFARIQKVTPERLQWQAAQYELQKDAFLFNGEPLPSHSETLLPGGLYYHCDRETDLDWAIPGSRPAAIRLSIDQPKRIKV